jgi:DNA-binding winged helix-turn-helix (wHTH) protein
MIGKEGKRQYEFGPFRLDAAERLLLRDGEPVALTAKAFDTLHALVENHGRIVDQNIFTLRKLLGESSPGNQYIETVPKYGCQGSPKSPCCDH